MPRRLLQLLDTSDVLIGDGPEPVANGKRDRGITPGLIVDVSASTRSVRNHDAGSGRPLTGADESPSKPQREFYLDFDCHATINPANRHGEVSEASLFAVTVVLTEVDATRPRRSI